MKKNILSRYIWLIDLVYSNKLISFESIRQRWLFSSLNEDGSDYPISTFHHHRKAIWEIFDIDIKCEAKGGRNYYIQEADNLASNHMKHWLLDSFSVSNFINESRRLEKRILFEDIPSGKKFLNMIIEAMSSNHCLKITHQKFESEKIRTYFISPYCLKVAQQRWYVLAHQKEKLSIFSLDRIQTAEIMKETFSMPDDFDAELFFKDKMGVIMSKSAAEDVQIRVYGNQAKYIKALPLHHSQKEIEEREEYIHFEYHICPTFDFEQALLANGSSVEVLSPEWLREEMIDRIDNMRKRYQ